MEKKAQRGRRQGPRCAMLSYALWGQEGPFPAVHPVHLWEGRQLSSSPQDGAQAAGTATALGRLVDLKSTLG